MRELRGSHTARGGRIRRYQSGKRDTGGQSTTCASCLHSRHVGDDFTHSDFVYFVLPRGSPHRAQTRGIARRARSDSGRSPRDLPTRTTPNRNSPRFQVLRTMCYFWGAKSFHVIQAIQCCLLNKASMAIVKCAHTYCSLETARYGHKRAVRTMDTRQGRTQR